MTSIARAALLLLVFVPSLRTYGNPADAARHAVALMFEGAKPPNVVDKAPGYDALARSIANVLRVRCYRVEGMIVKMLTIDGTNAVVQLEVATRKADRRTPDVWLPLDTMPLRLKLTQRDGAWLVTAFEFPNDELAGRIVAAEGEERAKLLAEADVTRNLVRAIAARASALSNTTEVHKAAPLAELTGRLAQIIGDRGAEALSNLTLSVVRRTAGDREKGLQHAREALRIAQETGEPDLLARAWRNLGQSLDAFDQFSPEASHAIQQSLAIAEFAEDPRLYVRALQSISGDAFVRRDYFTARRYLERTLPTIRATQDVVGEIVYEMQTALIYYDQLDPELTRHHTERAIALMEQSNQKWVYATAMRILGTLHADEGRVEEAKKAFAKSLATVLPDNADTIAGVTSSLALIEADEGRLDEAECLFRQAGPIAQKAGYAWGATLHRMAPHLIERGEYLRALRLSLDDASRMQIAAPAAAVAALNHAAVAYRRLGLIDRALATVLEAIDMREELNARTAGGETQQVRMSEAISASYELAAELTRERGDLPGALTLIERGRGRVLFDTVQNGRPTADAELAAADRTRAAEFDRELARLNVELERNGSDQLRDKLDAVRREYESFRDGLRARTQRRTTPVRTAPIDEVVAQLPAGLVAVEYVLREKTLEAFVLGRDVPLTHRSIDVDRKKLEARIDELARMFERNDLRYRAIAKELYAMLIAPLEAQLAGADALCIVPDEALWKIPFAALIDGRDRFLIERHAIVYAPSLNVYTAMAQRRADVAQSGALALANPSVDAKTEQQIATFFRDVDLAPLPATEEEAEAVCALHGRCTVLRRGEATESRVKNALRGVRLVHFATHGLLDDRNPMYSRLVLARGTGDDGSLEAWEIAGLDVDADLVVLSACDTARGRIGGGEGVVGMAWSFFLAGARSTLATQWKVGSESAADLMIAFHQSLRARERDASLKKARALRDAQLRMLRNAETRHPFYWAAFVILGDAS